MSGTLNTPQGMEATRISATVLPSEGPILRLRLEQSEPCKDREGGPVHAVLMSGSERAFSGILTGLHTVSGEDASLLVSGTPAGILELADGDLESGMDARLRAQSTRPITPHELCEARDLTRSASGRAVLALGMCDLSRVTFADAQAMGRGFDMIWISSGNTTATCCADTEDLSRMASDEASGLILEQARQAPWGARFDARQILAYALMSYGADVRVSATLRGAVSAYLGCASSRPPRPLKAEIRGVAYIQSSFGGGAARLTERGGAALVDATVEGREALTLDLIASATEVQVTHWSSSGSAHTVLLEAPTLPPALAAVSDLSEEELTTLRFLVADRDRSGRHSDHPSLLRRARSSWVE